MALEKSGAFNYFNDLNASDTFLAKVTNKEVLGTISPLVLDHMNREECYYLTKLSFAAGTRPPQCDAEKPRINF
jgi:hypothetical protein